MTVQTAPLVGINKQRASTIRPAIKTGKIRKSGGKIRSIAKLGTIFQSATTI